MADILAALDALDAEQNKKPAFKSNPKSVRHDALPKPPGKGHSEQPPSVGGDSGVGGISFADPPRPSDSARRIWISTKTDSLASGFLYDPRLNRYNVSEKEWEHFNTEVLQVVNIPGPSWAWSFNRKTVIKQVKKELHYEGDLNRLLRKWNKLFKRQGFIVTIELPVEEGAPDMDNELVGDTAEERKKARRDAKRFRICVQAQPLRSIPETSPSKPREATESKSKPETTPPAPLKYLGLATYNDQSVLSKAVSFVKDHVRSSYGKKETEDGAIINR